MLEPITDAEESKIREQCRMQYRETGETVNPYEKGTIKALVFESEVNKILFLEDAR